MRLAWHLVLKALLAESWLSHMDATLFRLSLCAGGDVPVAQLHLSSLSAAPGCMAASKGKARLASAVQLCREVGDTAVCVCVRNRSTCRLALLPACLLQWGLIE